MQKGPNGAWGVAVMDELAARTLVANERRRIEAALADVAAEEDGEKASHFDQTGESKEAGSEIQQELVDDAVVAALRKDLEAVVRAEARIEQGTYGLSIESGAVIPEDRLRADPLAERTIDEQARFERSQR